MDSDHQIQVPAPEQSGTPAPEQTNEASPGRSQAPAPEHTHEPAPDQDEAPAPEQVHESTSEQRKVPAPDRIKEPGPVMLWRRRFYVLGASLAIAAAALVLCLLAPKTYQATATVVVSLPPATSGGVTSESVTASSDLAGQYAQLATLRPTLLAAAKTLGVSESQLTGSASAGVIASQNLVAVNATARNGALAQQRANAVAHALVVGISHSNAVTLYTYSRNVTRALGSTNRQIGTLRRDIARNAGHTAIVSADTTLLSSLVAQRQQAQSELAQEAANEPAVSVASEAGEASQAQPKTVLYTLIAFIVGLLVAGQLAVVYPASGNRVAPAPAEPPANRGTRAAADV
jgi:uncharacterized protein involved in exopolysaccharide biosynthesis